jgi:hypothetical protein
MSSSEASAATADLAAQVTRLAAELRAIAERGAVEEVPDEALQALLTAAVKLYVAKREAGAEIGPFVDDSVTATEVSVAATSMIKAADLQLFELSLWHGFGTIEGR